VAERGMGRGLAAILPAPSTQEDGVFREIPPSLIDANPRQPRTLFAEPELEALAESIRARGVLQPILVRPATGGRYELIAGERRLRAARMAQLERIPAVIRSAQENERLELALIENMAREDLNPVEAARACAALVDELGLTKEDVSRRCGRSRAGISNLIRLLELPDDVLEMLERGELTEGHGRALLQAKDRGALRRLAGEARNRGWSVRETEAMARSSASEPAAPRRPQLVPADLTDARRAAEDQLSAVLGREARVRLRRRGGVVEIPFEDLAEVRDLVRMLSGRMAA
jgi:ParB family chromosome partitioning protein